MNTVTTIAPQADIQAAVAQPKAVTKAGGGDFRDMLSGALKNAAKRPEKAASKAETNGAAKPAKDKVPADVKDKKAQQDAPTDEAAISAAAENAAAQLQAQAPADAQPDGAGVEAETSVQAVQAVPVQAVPAQAWTVQAAVAKPEAESQAVPAQAVPAQARTVQAAAAKPETESQVQNAQAVPAQAEQQQPVHTQTEYTQTVQASGGAQPEQAVQVMQEQPVTAERTAERTVNRTQAPRTAQTEQTAQTARTERQPMPEKAAEAAVSVEVAEQPKENVKAQTVWQAVRQPETEAVRDDPAQARFDGMIDKARQELSQAKTEAVQEQPAAAAEPEITETETPVTAGPVKAAEPEEDAEVLQPAADKRENVTAETRREGPRTESIRTQAPERPEQKTAKTARTTEETNVNAVQPKAQHTPQAETVRTQRQEPPQTARTPDQYEQIRTQVVQNLEDRKMEFNMQLHPQELGKVNVKMILEGGKLAIEIVAANAKSAEILGKQTEALAASLKLNGPETASISVVTAGENASGHMDGEYDPGSFRGQDGRQDGQGSGSNGRSGKADHGETAGRQAEAAAERQPRGILNYSI